MKKLLAGGFLSFCVLTAVKSATVSADEEMKDIPIAVGTERAFPNLDFERPIVVTHAGDGTNRLFVAEQDGISKVLKNDQDAEEATVFLDIDERCTYADNQNEEGLLGFCFHPKFKENGQLFVYYTSAEEAHLSKVSRFTVSKDNPNFCDAASEE